MSQKKKDRRPNANPHYHHHTKEEWELLEAAQCKARLVAIHKLDGTKEKTDDNA